MSRRSPLDQDQVTVAGQSWQGDGGGGGGAEVEMGGGGWNGWMNISTTRQYYCFEASWSSQCSSGSCRVTLPSEEEKKTVWLCGNTSKNTLVWRKVLKWYDVRIDFGAPTLWSSDWCIPSHQSRLLCADSPPIKNKERRYSNKQISSPKSHSELKTTFLPPFYCFVTWKYQIKLNGLSSDNSRVQFKLYCYQQMSLVVTT